MKELQLPKAIPIRFYLNDEQPKSRALDEDFSVEMAVIEKNGSEILSSAIMMEDRMVEAVSKILFGVSAKNGKNREFFVNEIMGTSDFSYAFKRRVFTRLLEQLEIIEPDETKRLKTGLNKIMEWRNAFAHGQVLYEHNGGFVLQYFSGGHKEMILDDDFFENVESTIRNCLYTCNGIIQSQKKHGVRSCNE
ncbi:MAG: hypothetical protein Q8Q50_13210 [Methylobacter sp.]|nr:hypothetical protein [Methylobacter sp.]